MSHAKDLKNKTAAELQSVLGSSSSTDCFSLLKSNLETDKNIKKEKKKKSKKDKK